jgi:sulfur dioxygenase
MIFRQLFDQVSGTYTYLLASRRGGEALIIDPVLEKVDRYLQLMRELDLKLVKAVDTHLHADHITGLGALRDRTHCITVMGEQTQVDVVSMRIADGDQADDRGISLDVIYTPATPTIPTVSTWRPRVHRRHAADPRHRPHRFPERRSARAIRFDLQQAAALPDETLVFPAHDYKGDTVSTIGEEKPSTRGCRSNRPTNTPS